MAKTRHDLIRSLSVSICRAYCRHATELIPRLPVKVFVLKHALPFRSSFSSVCRVGFVFFAAFWSVAAQPVYAEEVAAGPLDTALLRNVLTSALHFLQPRTLESHTSRTFCLWGLDGLTAIDPALSIDEVQQAPQKPATLRLSMAQHSLTEVSEPGENDLGAWVGIVVSAMGTAWQQSATLRTAGREALLQSFFDELFNHLDPYSRYVGPAPAIVDRSARTGSDANVGLTLSHENGAVVVSAINANGPAWAAGVNLGQHLLAVDGRSTRGQEIGTIENWLNGAAGSRISLTLADPGRRHAVLRLTRAVVPPQTVFSYTRGHLAVLRITAFSTETAEELRQYLDQAMQDPKLSGLVFDLRGDRGGVLQQAVTATALVLDRGVAVVTKGRDPKANHIWAVQGGDMTHGLPIAVLVDGRTASAAEIMAAALADHRRAVVIGSSTLGKGLVQSIGQMPNGGELFVTWSRVLAPLEWPLQGLGITPQICTSRGEAALEKQIEALAQGTVLDRDAIRASRAVRYPVAVSRILDIRRNCPAAIGTDADLQAAQTILQKPNDYRTALEAIPDDLGDNAP